MSLKKIHLGLGFMTLAGCLLTSYINDKLFMEHLLVASGILSCVLLVKAIGNS